MPPVKRSNGLSPTKKKGKDGKEPLNDKIEITKLDNINNINDSDDMDIYHEPIKQVVIPTNQLKLTEMELREECTRVLTGNDPNLPNNITKYNYKERLYKIDPPGPDDHLYFHFINEGSAIHKESEDAKAQFIYEQKKLEELKEIRELCIKQAKEEADSKGEKLDESTLQLETGKNQFNYSERAAQTFTNPLRHRSVETEPPPVLNFMSTVTQWEIYDAYMENYEAHQREQIQLQKAGIHKKEKEGNDLGTNSSISSNSNINPNSNLNGNHILNKIGMNKEDDMVHSVAMSKSLKIMERMVNQNAEDEIFQDFKYWEDASDQFREGEGSLLPLWRFNHHNKNNNKNLQVTSICWNKKFTDLFAVGYGSYDFLKQGSGGLICCFSLKNTSHPEYIFSVDNGIGTSSITGGCGGVMCLDFHSDYPALLAVGCYDGTVLVYDIRNKINKPIYYSTIKTGKHTDPVWQVSWQNDHDITNNLNNNNNNSNHNKELNFFSISTDGRVCNWIMSKNELKMEPVMQLKLIHTINNPPNTNSNHSVSNSNGSIPNHSSEDHLNNLNGLSSLSGLSGLAGGICFDFNKNSEHLFLVGTEEGKIHKCSKAYSGQYLDTYIGHHMAVYSVQWNSFHPRVFISCSADWTVKLWDISGPSDHPFLTFDLGNPVGDVCWSPYSSTIFAAITNDGKVHIYDINENKNEPLCEQKIVKKSKLTKIIFNKKEPIILVGDDRGGINSLKLSPNLRKIAFIDTNDINTINPTPINGNNIDNHINIKGMYQSEIDKMDKLLSTVENKGLK